MRLAFVITPRLHYRAVRELTRLMPSARWAYAFFLGVPLLLVIIVLVLGLGVHTLIDNWFGIVAGPLFIFGFLPALAYWQVRSSHRTNAALQGEQIYEFAANGMSTNGPLHTTSVQWNGIHKVVETRTFFFVFLSSRQAYFVPRDVVARQVGIEQFRMMLRSYLPDKTKLRED